MPLEINADGLMLWVPSGAMERLSMSPELGHNHMERNPKARDNDAEFSILNSPSTPSARTGHVNNTPDCLSLATVSILPSWEYTFKEQLQDFAAAAAAPTLNPESSYESDSTDFLFQPSATPCPDMESKGISKKKRPVNRRLFYGCSTTKRQSLNGQKSENIQALENLKYVEHSPRHQYTEEERELICVLFRFYISNDFTPIFNGITGLNLPKGRVTIQFQSHLRYHGARAFPHSFGRVFNCALNDPNNNFAAARGLTEKTAKLLQIQLKRRESNDEALAASGQAAKSKSKRVRKAHQALIRQASSAKAPLHNNNPYIQPKEIATAAPKQTELYVDVNTQPKGQCTTAHAALAYRVFSNQSYTMYDPEIGFYTRGYANWHGQFLPPLSPDKDQVALLFLGHRHLSKTGGDASAYISVTTSLLQAMKYAATQRDPHIGLINLSHQSLQQEHKVIHAAKIIRKLRQHSQLSWTKYKGETELLIWANISKDALLAVRPLQDLYNLQHNHTCAGLGLDAFIPGRTTRIIGRNLRQREVPLDARTARAIGMMGKELGMDDKNVSCQHIAEFIARVVDGWGFRVSDQQQSMSAISMVFSKALASNSRIFGLQDVGEAFRAGVAEGLQSRAYYTSRMPKSRPS
ncbi:hypothetical protein CC80DRAFT_502613 [Byssothecium circinans]|uniref:DUF7587 domain-containing protein n=1 Tax=Byssothecium circinans TaxID=147558 RepID=A0A6A5U1G2_9PLEO|nr:hypothetical protein CC80DRAFT_502613 [Byssothecium circinans]